MEDEGQCRLCQKTADLTRHHLIPKAWFRKNHGIPGVNHPLNLIPLCLYCHAAVDGYLPAGELSRHLVLHRQLLKRIYLRQKLTEHEVAFMAYTAGDEWVDHNYPLYVE